MSFRPSVLRLSSLRGLTQCIRQGEGAYPVPPLPDATQTGANTAGCFVDGQRWVASSNIPGFSGTLPATRARWDNFSVGRPHLSLSFDKYIAAEAQVHNETNVFLYKSAGDTRWGKAKPKPVDLVQKTCSAIKVQTRVPS